MADQAIEIKGLDELFSGSRRLFDRIGKAAGDEFERVAGRVADEISARMPRRTGAMAGAVQAKQERDKVLVGFEKAGLPYAGWVEFGGGSRPGRPYVSSGRTVFPTAMPMDSELVRAGTKATEQEIRGFRWPSP